MKVILSISICILLGYIYYFMMSRPLWAIKKLFKKEGIRYCGNCCFYVPKKGFIGNLCNHPNNRIIIKDELTGKAKYINPNYCRENINMNNNCIWYVEGEPDYNKLNEIIGRSFVGRILSEGE